MGQYKYQIRDRAGSISSGVLAAGSLAEASSLLRGQGQVVDVVPIAAGAKGLLAALRKVSVDFGPSLKDVLSFTSQLAVMVKAGINIRQAVEGIADQIENVKFKKIVEQIRADVESGKPFSEALGKHPKVFGPLYVNMVKASEMSGSFGHMLDRIAENLQQSIETRSMVRGAMIYPIIIGTMAIGTTIFLLTFVLPRFSMVFQGKEHILPAPTKFLLGLSAFLRGYWYLIVGALGGAMGGFLYFKKTPFGRRWWDGAKMRIPLIKRMLRALYITRGLQTMGEMINAGVPMLDTLRITADVSGNSLYSDMWMGVFRSVKGGKTISAPLMRGRLLPRNVVQMVAAGEESGNLGEVLKDISAFYAQELRNTIKAVTAMIEPLMIVCMGVVVGFIAMSIILPIFKMSQLVK